MDQQLLSRMASGDTAAFAQFYDRHASRVLGALARWLGENGDAEDVLQETFWQVWCHAGKYDAARGTPEVWLFVIARSRALDYLRQRRLPDRPCTDPEPAMVSDPLTELEWSETTEQLRQVLAKLPNEQRSAIYLAFYEGLTYDQVAQSQGIPLGTAKTRIRLGLKRLRELLRHLEGI